MQEYFSDYQSLAQEYERLASKRKNSKKWFKWISLAFIPLVAVLMTGTIATDADVFSALGGLTLLGYMAFWGLSIPYLLLTRNKERNKEMEAFYKKAAYEEAAPYIDGFSFAPLGGLSEETLYGSGLVNDGRPDVRNYYKDPPVRSHLINKEYMTGICNGIRFERANVNLSPGREVFEVNWMVFTLPENTMTGLTYMSGRFIARNATSDFPGKSLGKAKDGGLFFHMGGEKPSEYHKQCLMRLAAAIGSDCELSLFGNKLHVLVRREGYISDIPLHLSELGEDEIRRQLSGRIAEITECVKSMPEVFPEGITETKKRKPDTVRMPG
ncbi:MAG: hypothetical protein IKW95_04440 [Lachnospiraceae bacterium]|nr:hypothetical protein [Lachnospiraceae bacterium]